MQNLKRSKPVADEMKRNNFKDNTKEYLKA